MTTVGQAARPSASRPAVTIATALKSLGYSTAISAITLGRSQQFLPTVHGFDEFFGYLYHLDAMEDPAHPAYPQELLDRVGPRNMVHSWATDKDDPVVMPRWGKVGKQKIEDAGTLYPERMKTVDDEIRDLAFKFVDKAKAEGKPFFLWLNPTRMHIVTHLSEKYEKMRNSKNGWTIHEAGMRSSTTSRATMRAQDLGSTTHHVVSTDTARRTSPGPMATDTFPMGKGTVMEAVSGAAIIAGRQGAAARQNGSSPYATVPDLPGRAGESHWREPREGPKLGDTPHGASDGYNNDLITASPSPATRLYFVDSELGGVSHRRCPVPLHRSPALLVETHLTFLPTTLRLDPSSVLLAGNQLRKAHSILRVVSIESGPSCSSREVASCETAVDSRPCRRGELHLDAVGEDRGAPRSHASSRRSVLRRGPSTSRRPATLPAIEMIERFLTALFPSVRSRTSPSACLPSCGGRCCAL